LVSLLARSPINPNRNFDAWAVLKLCANPILVRERTIEPERGAEKLAPRVPDEPLGSDTIEIINHRSAAL
jgi:hypothetical protein